MKNSESFEKAAGILLKWKKEPAVDDMRKVLSEIKTKLESIQAAEVNPKPRESIQQVVDSYLSKFVKKSMRWADLKEKYVEKIIILNSKLQTINETLDGVLTISPEEIYWLDESHPRWQRLNQAITYVIPANEEALRKSYKSFIHRITVGHAFMVHGLEETSPVKRNLMSGLGAMYFFFSRKEAKRKQALSCAKAKIEVAKRTWNLLDSWLCNKMLTVVLKKIHENVLIYLPRTAPHIITDETAPCETAYSLTPVADFVQVRLLCHSYLITKPKERSGVWCWTSRDKKIRGTAITTVIFHVHGGGFISMSSNAHQNYSRRWARDLDALVFSVDYKLAPEFPFPRPLDDVWQAYCWLVTHGNSLGIRLHKVILTGDSAGGNLVLAFALKICSTGVRPPDGIVLSYPATKVSMQDFTPSMLISLEDGVLPHTFLKLCIESYVQNEEFRPNENMLISPVYAEESVLEKLPPVRMALGDDDPLYCDSMKLLEKMVKCGVDAKATVFKATPHGVLAYYLPGGVKEAKGFYKTTVGFFRELFGIE
jgi:hormone-sensitive lipase